MFEDFPYSNLHQLNLDWLVDIVEKLHDNLVISVNGQTGEVILYQNATMQLPNVDDRTWTIIRNTHGVKRGIKFDSDGTAYIVSGNSLASVFTPENPPASSQITYDQYVRLTTLTGEQLHNWNIFRTLNDVSTGIEFDDTGEAYIISGSNRYRLYSTKNPNVSSVNGQTGDVVLYTDSNGEMTLPGVTNPNVDAWSIGRTINGTACRIYIYDDGQVTITAGNDEYRLVNSDELSDLEDEVTDLKSALDVDENDLAGYLKTGEYKLHFAWEQGAFDSNGVDAPNDKRIRVLGRWKPSDYDYNGKTTVVIPSGWSLAYVRYVNKNDAIADYFYAWATGTVDLYPQYYYRFALRYGDGSSVITPADAPDFYCKSLSYMKKMTGDNEHEIDKIEESNIVYPVDETSKVSGKFITQYGTDASNAGYAYIDEVSLKRGETIVVSATFPDNNVAVFSTRFSEALFEYYRKPISLSATGTIKYTYTATKDTVLTVCFPTSHECYIINGINELTQRLNNADVDDNKIKLEKLYDNQFSGLYDESPNKYDYNNLIFGQITSDGTIDTNASYKTNITGIYCHGQTKAYAPSAAYHANVQALWWAFYDENDEFISPRSASYQSEITIPAEAYYMRVTFPVSTLNDWQPMVTFNSVVPKSFIPVGRVMKQFEEKQTGIVMNYMQMFTNIGIVGDSLSSGALFNQSGTYVGDKYQYSWLSNICRKIGAKPHHYSVGGMTAKGWVTSQYRTALENETDTLEAYYIALGTNDKNQTYPVGSASDAAGSDSFAGYIKQIIGIIHTKAPNAIIFCNSLYDNGSTANQYSNVVKDIAELYDYCYYIDFVGNAVPELIIPNSRIYTNYVENWHYTGLGYIAAGNTIEELTNKVIGENLSAFKFFSADQP